MFCLFSLLFVVFAMEKFDSEALALLKVNRPTQSTKIQRLLIYLFIATSTIYYSLNNKERKKIRRIRMKKLFLSKLQIIL